MKKTFASTVLMSALVLGACNSNNDTSSTMTDTTTTMTNTMSNDTGMGTAGTMNTNGMNTTGGNFSSSDKDFVIEAAKGGMMEVEAGNIAQQNGVNQKVKDFGAMMVRDHSKANDELKNLAASKGYTIPTDSLMKANQSHLDAMRKMEGKKFDDHYASMMVSDHKKDISAFEKQANSADDADLKAFASKTLPVLRMHLDSAQAMDKAVH